MLTISKVSKTYDNGVCALNNITLTIKPGMFGLLGPNGAGKSSLMRTIATLQQPSAGTISFAGQDIIRQPQLLRPQLGYLPQEFGVYPGVSAQNLLQHFALLKGLSERKARQRQIDALLELTNLTAHRKSAVSSFSGGMKQRFGIAQALLGAPKLLVVDEPTAGLDPEERNRFHNLLSELSESIVVILSTHIVEDVRNLCPDMAILAQGQIISQGAPTQLMATLDGRLWRTVIAKQQLAEYQARYRVLSQRLVAGQLELHVLSEHCPGADFSALKAELEDAYFAILASAASAKTGKVTKRPVAAEVASC